MTGRYIRKAVPLEVRGVCRGAHPLPEKCDDPTNQLFSCDPDSRYTHGCGAGVGGGGGASGPSSASHRSDNSIFSTSHGWTSGNTTDRSSSYSLGDDEFDRVASERVWHMFEEIDAMLFEKDVGPQELLRECEEWLARFPHLRILGKQKMVPQESGYELLLLSPSPRGDSLLVDVNEQDISALSGQLSILGQQASTHRPQSDLDVPHLDEEVFAQDGLVEDVIAVDYKSLDDDIRSMPARRRRAGMPPVTPHACIRNNVMAAIFDFIWTETISWMRELIATYTKLITDTEPADMEDDDVDALAMLNLSETTGFSPPRDIFPPSREISFLGVGREKRLLTSCSLNAAIEGRLEDLLTISTKALQSREKSCLQDPLELSLSLQPSRSLRLLDNTRYPETRTVDIRPTAERPTTERPTAERPTTERLLESRTTDIGPRPASVRHSDYNRLTSARTKTTTTSGANRGRLLAPLALERAKTPNADEERRLQNEVLRGHRLHTSPPPPAPPSQLPRNGTLPPIAAYDLPEITTALVKPASDRRVISAPNPPHGATSAPPRCATCAVTNAWAADLVVVGTAVTLHSRSRPLAVNDRRKHRPSAVNQRSKPHPQTRRLPFSRITSAFHDKESTLPYKEKERSFGALETRPSTTHTLYRADTPFGRRSSTPLGLNNNFKTQGVASHQLNVTGSGINPQSGGDMVVSAAAAGGGADVDMTPHLEEFNTNTATTHWGGASSQVRRGRSQQHCHMPVS